MLSASGEKNKSMLLSWEQQLCRRFSLPDIQSATQNFDDALIIGRGGFGKVYKGAIGNGVGGITIVAIKRLDSGSNQGAPEFWAEIEMLSKLRHCNLVSLIGYCNDSDEMILVYEYMPLGTLDNHLHKVDSPLSWVQRLKICIGAARGLDYLHTGTGTLHGVIHRDVKSSNILLDENWAAKISDFGLSKIGPANQQNTYVSTAVKGTFGYLDPEYFYTGRLTRKSDVYAFGVVLLEVLCGRRAVDTSLEEEQWGLACWAQDYIKEGKLDQLIDTSLKGHILPKCLKEFARIADRCLHSRSKQRPMMGEVVVGLQLALSLQEISSEPVSINKLTRKMQKFFFLSLGLNYAPSGSSEEYSGNFQEVLLARHLLPQDLFIFSFNELGKATKNFNKKNFLGQDEFGKVYKGWVHKKTYSPPSTLEVGMAVAIKRLYPGKVKSLKLLVKRLAQYNHANFVKLLGYCLEDKEFLLVYEFMEKENLASHLFESAELLPWITRVKILLGAAEGLAFLHTTMEISSNGQFEMHNILLDGAFSSKLPYLGLELEKSKFPAFRSSTLEDFCNDYPYAPPETWRGEYGMKSDVFVFGVVLLEALTGLPKNSPDWKWRKRTLAVWARLEFPSAIMVDELDYAYNQNMVDPRLVYKFSPEGAILLVKLAQKCLEDIPKDRPSMEQVLIELRRVYQA